MSNEVYRNQSGNEQRTWIITFPKNRRINIGLLLTTVFITISLCYLRWERRVDSCMGD